MYRQEGDLLWGEFSGGQARRGALTGTCAPTARWSSPTAWSSRAARSISGRCPSTPTVLADGRIRLHEEWERYGARRRPRRVLDRRAPPDRTRQITQTAEEA